MSVMEMRGWCAMAISVLVGIEHTSYIEGEQGFMLSATESVLWFFLAVYFWSKR